jgi:transcriptional regulator with XRE-family HTH domain
MSEYQWGQAARIRCLRDYLGLSVNELAAALNVSTRSYQSFESGRAAIPAGVMADVNALVHRLDVLAADYSSRDELSIADMSAFELRAAGIAAAANQELQISQ